MVSGVAVPRRMASDSASEIPEKHQQVPELAWFLTEVMGLALTVVNWKPSFSSLGCANAVKVIRPAAARRMSFFIWV